MSGKAKREYLDEIKKRYFTSTKLEKGQILDEFCTNCSYNRKYAIRLIHKKKSPKQKKRAGRPNVYYKESIIRFLKDLWVATNLVCSQRLKETIASWLPYYELHYKNHLSEHNKEKLLRISSRTIDRLLKRIKSKHKKLGLSTTKPGSLLKKHIPIKVEQWDEFRPGFLEADTVAHCGTSVAGQFVYTLDVVDIATGWTEQRAVWGKGRQGVFTALKSIVEQLPFKILGFDSDNGSEFLNWNLLEYFTNRKNPVQYTRSREYRKNDNAHIEEKNWTHVRQYLGYLRFDNNTIVPLMNNLYLNEWRLFLNYFIPSFKLISKERVGSKITKKFDPPKTPYQRLIESTYIKPQMKKQLTNTLDSLDPFKLQTIVKTKIIEILHLAPG
jgi:hypothetical protein